MGEPVKQELSDEQARFIVRVMDSLVQHPAMLDEDIVPARRELDALYDKHGRWSKGSINGRAEWLQTFLRTLSAQKGQPQ